MGWVTKNGHKYYYRSIRIDGKVKRIYCGAGQAAEQAAQEDIDRRHAAQKIKNECTQTLTVLRNLLLMQESLLSSKGFHYPKRGPLRKMNARTLKRRQEMGIKTPSEGSITKTLSKKKPRS